MLVLSSLILEEPQCSGPLAQSFISTSKQQIYWFSCEFYILPTNPQSPSRMNSTIFVLTALVTDILSVGHLPQHCCRRVWGLCRLWEIRFSSQQTAMKTLNATHSSPRQRAIPGTLATPAPQFSLHASVHPDFSADGTMMLGSTLTAAVIQVPLNTLTLQCLTASSTPKLTCPGKLKVFSLLKKQLWCSGGGMDGQKDRHTRETRTMCRVGFAVSLSFYLCGGVCV